MTYAAIGDLGLDNLETFWRTLALQQTNAGPLWTIPPEMVFYVALPIVMVVMLALGGWARIAALAGLAIIVGALTYFYPPLAAPVALEAGYYAVCFGSGVAAAYIAHAYKIQRAPWWPAWLAMAVLIAFTVIAKSGPDEMVLLNKHFVYGPLFAVLAFTVHVNGSRFFANPVLVRIGEAAFSIYLFHWIFVPLFRETPLYVGPPAVIALSIFLGMVLYRVVELPIYSLRLHFRGKTAT